MDRVTLLGLNKTVINNVQQTLARLATYQEQLSTGKKVNRVSDDVVAARQALRYTADASDTGKYLDNIDKSLAFMGATDSAFSQVTTIYDQVKSIAVQGANASEDAASRNALAQSVDSYLSQLIDVANTVHDGRFIFGGTATTSGKPFALSADGTRVDYGGNLDSFNVQIGTSSTIAVNQNGYDLFKGKTDVFDALIQLRDALKANDPTKVSQLIDTVDAAQSHANDLQGAMGGREQRLQLAQTQLQAEQVYQKQLISQAQDADFTETISNMQLTQTALEAGLQAASKTITPSLLNFLG
jgi:flagellar hook-associated protein 3 FlgL